jgi:hypothetical protein
MCHRALSAAHSRPHTHHTGPALAQQPTACSGDLLNTFDRARLESLPNAFTMALLASDAYPATLLPGASNAKYNTLKYEAALRKRWAALGARTVAVVDDWEDNLEAHAVVAATATDVFISFRGTSTTEGWAANARLSPWKVAAGADGQLLQVHGGFLQSFVSIYPRLGLEVARALESAVAAPAKARIYISGHSLGGAHAMLAAMALQDNGANIGGVWTVRGRGCGGRRGGLVWARSLHLAAASSGWGHIIDRLLTTANATPIPDDSSAPPRSARPTLSRPT